MAGHQRKERKQTSSSQPTRKAAAHAAKLKSRRVPKGRAAATKARLLDLTAELDSQMTDVHASYAQTETETQPLVEDAPSTAVVHDLAEVLRGL